MTLRPGAGSYDDVSAALHWFLDVAPDRAALEQRIQRAQQHYRVATASDGVRWPCTSRVVLNQDLVASCLAQGFALLEDPRCYDRVLGAQIVPFLRDIGQGLEVLRRRPGAVGRVRRMLTPGQEHPAACLFELAAAGRYTREDFEVEFLQESGRRAGDLSIRIAGIARAMQIECRTLRPARYELRERAHVRRLFDRAAPWIHSRRLSVDVELCFDVEVERIPPDYLAAHMLRAVDSAAAMNAAMNDTYSWRDEFGAGSVRSLGVERAMSDIKSGAMPCGAGLARALSGRHIDDDAFFMALRARPKPDDPRRVDELDYATVFTWQSLAEGSLAARATHLSSQLRDIDRQLENAELGIVHIGMRHQGDTVSPDPRRQRHLDIVRRFIPRSKVAELHLHYYRAQGETMPPVRLEETVDRHSRWQGFLLDDSRLLNPEDLSA